MKRDIFIFLSKVVAVTAVIFVVLRLYGWVVNKPLGEFVNLIFYVAIILLIVVLIMVLIMFFRECKKEGKLFGVLNVSTLLIAVAIMLLLVSSILTFLICNFTS
jgi:hypothetical protein